MFIVVPHFDGRCQVYQCWFAILYCLCYCVKERAREPYTQQKLTLAPVSPPLSILY